MKYESEDKCARVHLGAVMFDTMRLLGLSATHKDGTKEQIFRLECTAGRAVLVYSTVVGLEARVTGMDSIKVCAVYNDRDGKQQPIGKAERRVHRIGEISAILDRVRERIVEVKQLCETAEACSCGAPKGLSKQKKLYCLDRCWLRDKAGNLPVDNWQPRMNRWYRR